MTDTLNAIIAEIEKRKSATKEDIFAYYINERLEESLASYFAELNEAEHFETKWALKKLK